MINEVMSNLLKVNWMRLSGLAADDEGVKFLEIFVLWDTFYEYSHEVQIP